MDIWIEEDRHDETVSLFVRNKHQGKWDYYQYTCDGPLTIHTRESGCSPTTEPMKPFLKMDKDVFDEIIGGIVAQRETALRKQYDELKNAVEAERNARKEHSKDLTDILKVAVSSKGKHNEF